MQIVDLTSASTPLATDDLLLVVQGGLTKKTTVGAVATGAANASTVPGASVDDALDYLLNAINNLGFNDSFRGLIQYGYNGTYVISIKTPFAGTITETVFKTDSGSCRATVKINSTALGGSNHACTTTEEAIARVSNNTFAEGDDIVIEIFDTLAASRVSYTIKYVRGL